jgi:hypothetical protein
MMLRKRLHRYYEDFTGNKAVLEESQMDDDLAAA